MYIKKSSIAVAFLYIIFIGVLIGGMTIIPDGYKLVTVFVGLLSLAIGIIVGSIDEGEVIPEEGSKEKQKNDEIYRGG